MGGGEGQETEGGAVVGDGGQSRPAAPLGIGPKQNTPGKNKLAAAVRRGGMRAEPVRASPILSGTVLLATSLERVGTNTGRGGRGKSTFRLLIVLRKKIERRMQEPFVTI